MIFEYIALFTMKAVARKNKELLNFYMEINVKTYIVSDLSYNYAAQIMHSFVKKSVLSEEKTYTEVFENDNKRVKDAFTELSELLNRKSQVCTKIF